MRNLWRRFRFWLDDERGICRLCQQGTVRHGEYVELVMQYQCVVVHGRYHGTCAMAAVEARFLARHTVTR